MCFHNSASVKAQQLKQRYKADWYREDEEIEPLFHSNGFTFPKWSVLTTHSPNKFQSYSWGLIPNWCKDKGTAFKMRLNTLNARSETIYEKPSFRGSIKSKRCLIPSTGFFEWQEYKGNKYPYFIRLKDEPIFSMAGIFETWIDKQTAEVFNTFSIVTCNANPLMAKIHNSKERMPVILTRENEMQWIREELTESEVKDLMQPLDENLMQAHTISKLITSRSENTNVPEVQNPVIYNELV